MAKPKKTPRPRAETPKGFRDYHGEEVRRRAAMLARIAEVYHLHGFDPLETSAVETVEALGKFLPDVDRPNEGVFAFREDGAEDAPWLALRYDLTAPLARVAAQYRSDLPSPYRRYAMGPVWRNEKPGPGRFRQFYQCDADTVGSASPAADAEILVMLARALEAVGIPASDYVIQINDRRLLNAVLDIAEVPTDGEARGIVLRAIDKIDRLGAHGVRALLGAGRKDESGDFTAGAGLSGPQADAIMAFVEANARLDERLAKRASAARDRGDHDLSDRLHAARDSVSSVMRDHHAAKGEGRRLWNDEMLAYLREVVSQHDDGWRGMETLDEIVRLAAAQGLADHRIRVNPSVVRGLGYYTGPVFEAELTFEITGEDGRPRQFGSVAGGGRYDDLVERFTGQKVPATGISIGVDRLLAALEARAATPPAPGPVVVTVMDRDRMVEYAEMARSLRDNRVRAEVYLGNPKNFGNQLKYADKRGAPVAVIQGSDEANRDVVQIKDLILGAEVAETATLEEWKDRPTQIEVPRAELVKAVKEVLSRHGLLSD